MATVTVTLKGYEWEFTWNALRGHPAPPEQAEMEQREMHRKLYYYFKAKIKELDGKPNTETYGIELSGRRRRMLSDVLANPLRPWPTAQLYEVVWPIREALGWKPPAADLSDDDEEEDVEE